MKTYIFKRNNSWKFTIAETKMKIGVSNKNAEPQKVCSYKIYKDGKLMFTAMLLDAVFHYIYTHNGCSKYITMEDFKLA